MLGGQILGSAPDQAGKYLSQSWAGQLDLPSSPCGQHTYAHAPCQVSQLLLTHRGARAFVFCTTLEVGVAGLMLILQFTGPSERIDTAWAEIKAVWPWCFFINQLRFFAA